MRDPGRSSRPERALISLSPGSLLWLLAGLAVLAASVAVGDEVHLRGGGRLIGDIVERTPTSISIETAPGRATVPLSRVERIVESRSAISEWLERSARLLDTDPEGWAELGRWAEANQLSTQARACWLRVAAVRPTDPEANQALGRERVGERWLSGEDAARARGLVPFEGRWVTPEDRRAALEERALQAREAEAEAARREAAAREAEARAAEARVVDTPAAEEEGIPVWLAGTSSYEAGCCTPGWHGERAQRERGRRHDHADRDRRGAQPATPQSAPAPRASIGTGARRPAPHSAGVTASSKAERDRP